jgi:O-antigen/teichoic acid export membrane protein
VSTAAVPEDGAGSRVRANVRSVSIATILVSIAGYLIIFLAARVLGPALSGVFMVFWSALYLAIGTVFGLQQETTRAVRSALTYRADGTRPVSVAAFSSGAVIAGLILVSSPFWSATAFGDDAVLFTVLIAVATLLYSGLASVAGALAGQGRWGSYSSLLVIEATARAGLFGIVIATSQSIAWLAIVSVVAIGCWIPLLALRSFRSAITAPNDSPIGRSMAQMFQGAVAAASSAAIITGFPLLLSLTSSHEDAGLLGVAILVVTITRGPILVPLNAFLGMMVGSFVDDPRRVVRRVLKPMGALLLVALVLSGVAWLIGEWVFTFVFGADYAVDGLFVAGCVFGAALIGAMSIAGAAVLARGRHLWYSAAWALAAVVAVVMLLTPLDLEARVLLALTAGPILGSVVHLVGLLRDGEPIPAH